MNPKKLEEDYARLSSEAAKEKILRKIDRRDKTMRTFELIVNTILPA